MKKAICIHSTRSYFSVGKEYNFYDKKVGDAEYCLVCDDALHLPWNVTVDEKTKLPMVILPENDVVALFREIVEKELEDVKKVFCTFVRNDAPYWTVGEEYTVEDDDVIWDDGMIGTRMPWGATKSGDRYEIRDSYSGDPMAAFSAERSEFQVECIESNVDTFKVGKVYTVKRDPKDSAWKELFPDLMLKEVLKYAIAPHADEASPLPKEFADRMYFGARKTRSGNYMIEGNDIKVVFKEV